MHWPTGNATDLIWRVLASSDRISSWTPLKPQHSNPMFSYSSYTSHHPSQTSCLPWISYATQKLKLDSCKMVSPKAIWSIPYVSVAFFPSLKHHFIAYHSSEVSDCIFEIDQLWQSDFSRVYSNCCCSCSFEPEILKVGQSSHKMYSNKILNFQESTTILNACTKKSGNLLNAPHIYVWVCMCVCGFMWVPVCVSVYDRLLLYYVYI